MNTNQIATDRSHPAGCEYLPLKVIVASVTTSAALMLGGVALMVLPTMVVGNELLILGVVALAVGGWFLAHRPGAAGCPD